jgi:hypothetical protein
MAELRSVATPELKCLFVMVNRIKYTPVVDIVDYFKNVHKMSRPSDCHESWVSENGQSGLH